MKLTRRAHWMAGCACAALAAGAQAQTYPSKPLRLIVPLAPGGPSDILARTIGAAITPSLGQQVIVENRRAPAASSASIGSKAPPDGYTLVFGISRVTPSTAALYKKLPYDANTRPGADRRRSPPAPFIFCCTRRCRRNRSRNSSRSQKRCRAKSTTPPARRHASAAGDGNVQPHGRHKIVNIPYKGTGQALTDTLAGQVQVGMFGILAALPTVQAGRLRALAVTELRRWRCCRMCRRWPSPALPASMKPPRT